MRNRMQHPKVKKEESGISETSHILHDAILCQNPTDHKFAREVQCVTNGPFRPELVSGIYGQRLCTRGTRRSHCKMFRLCVCVCKAAETPLITVINHRHKVHIELSTCAQRTSIYVTVERLVVAEETGDCAVPLRAASRAKQKTPHDTHTKLPEKIF
jgi:hypothetical protein